MKWMSRSSRVFCCHNLSHDKHMLAIDCSRAQKMQKQYFTTSIKSQIWWFCRFSKRQMLASKISDLYGFRIQTVSRLSTFCIQTP